MDCRLPDFVALLDRLVGLGFLVVQPFQDSRQVMTILLIMPFDIEVVWIRIAQPSNEIAYLNVKVLDPFNVCRTSGKTLNDSDP